MFVVKVNSRQELDLFEMASTGWRIGEKKGTLGYP